MSRRLWQPSDCIEGFDGPAAPPLSALTLSATLRAPAPTYTPTTPPRQPAAPPADPPKQKRQRKPRAIRGQLLTAKEAELAKSDRLSCSIRNWIAQRIDPVDIYYKIKDHDTGEIRPDMISNAAYLRHLNARKDHHNRLDELKGWQVGLHRRGGGDLYGVPRIFKTADGRLGAWVRIDGDAHGGEPDAAEMVGEINRDHFDGVCPEQPSTNGHSAWATILFAAAVRLGNEIWSPWENRTPEIINMHLQRAERSLQAICRAKGYKASVELLGRPTEKEWGRRPRLLEVEAPGRGREVPQDRHGGRVRPASGRGVQRGGHLEDHRRR